MPGINLTYVGDCLNGCQTFGSVDFSFSWAILPKIAFFKFTCISSSKLLGLQISLRHCTHFIFKL